ncbi:S-receptor-like serine/threonine-protein kinase [Trema orientale]|uniref:Receptor-like serine/threonine-protein kinase n=1 Tax=Trema orientale TaxID=63057 RepID=A0A2P5BR70_TREOI|nr:S-receptor-like serine/threonine-protein kinase [Trema orientale]
MIMEASHLLIFYFLVSLSIFIQLSIASDSITSIQSIKDGDNTTLVSAGQAFELGFFSPANSRNRYIGIWFKRTPDVIVWVANRNNPLNDSYGEFTLSNKSNHLVLLHRSKTIVWSSNSSEMVSKNPVAQLLDSGNLVLRDNENQNSEPYLWQSFDYPTDTLLAGMKLGWDLSTGLERYLRSWKSDDDPSDGNYTERMVIKGLPQIIVFKGSTKKIRIGTWNGEKLSGFRVLSNYYIQKPVPVFNDKEAYFMFEPSMDSIITRIKLNSAGEAQLLTLQDGSNKWGVMYSAPYDQCDNYGYCGVNAVCSVSGDPICQCLEGFIPSSQEEWEVLNWSKGCKRKRTLECRKGEGFVKGGALKLPDLLEFWLDKDMSVDECEVECLKNCSCTAYTNSDVRNGGSGCLMWFGDLLDIREHRIKVGNNDKHDVYIRLSALDMKLTRDAIKRKRLKKIVAATSISSGICILGLLLGCITWKFKYRVNGEVKDKDIELPLFDLATITSATKNFSPENMIGAGGFGPVYKGNLPSGQQIAVKRLSKDSMQGSKEFKNEVQLIAKLQHKNLVTLLGCCIQEDERMLIYEYMPHKSLDHFIFDNNRTNTLSWAKNFEILMGIARGLLYLHQDSKLQIIHRDLKASNILLDINQNPKISDFGLARIFGGDEKETRTGTVVGTYGYMSPEYAVDGKFSVKSDVFSFGVLLLEIVSRKRNRRFSHPDHNHNLLGHAWLLWNEGKALELMDPSLADSCIEYQVLRCIHVGLLCVQKFSEDRPTMNSVLLMLSNEGAKLPQPKQPGFFIERSPTIINEDSTSTNEESYHSGNTTCITIPHGR